MIALFTIGFGRPDLLFHQKRLLDKYLGDEFGLCCIDNTPGIGRNMMEKVCRENGIGYLHNVEGKTGHDDGLNFAAAHVTQLRDHMPEYVGFLDGDIFPRKSTTLIDKISRSGFYGLPQTHTPSGSRYLWPGFCFFSKEWLGDRNLNFSGIRGVSKEDNGDCGSMNHVLFSAEDWNKMHLIGCGYGTIRDPVKPNENLQSYGYEIISDWVHLMNSSHWLAVRDPEGRDRLLMELIECL